MTSKYSHTRCSNLIRNIAISCDPVATDKNSLYPPFLHNRRSHIITDKRNIYSSPMQFISSEPCSLQQRTGLISKNLEAIASLLSQINGCQRRPIFGNSQMSGITMGQNPHSRTQQRQAIFADTPTCSSIFLTNGHRLPM